ncbi:MAG: EamA family transporter [Acidimicrobiia bacterium]|nr:MAG: EamA family transporter [Acidimicrobiia bacterium]
MTNDRATRGVMLALLAATLWGVTGAVAAGVFEVVSPARVAQTRSLVALAVLVPYAAHRGALRLEGGLWRFALLGVNLALVNVTFYWALDALGVGPGATIQFLGPILVLGWMVVVHHTKVRSLVWAAAAFAVFGVGLVTKAWTLEASDALGIAAGLASAVAFATYLLYGEYLGKTFRPAQIATWGFVFASLIWLVVLPIWTFPTAIGTRAWIDLIIIGVLGTAVPFIAGFAALRLAPSGIVGVIATAEPAIGAVAAAIMLGQALDPVQWVGVAAVVVAVAVVQRWGLTRLHPASPIA